MKTKTNKKTKESFNYAVTQRLRFIDFLLNQYGRINRTALMNFYGISQPQASEDMKNYMEIAPENMHYDNRAKAYVKYPWFKKVWK